MLYSTPCTCRWPSCVQVLQEPPLCPVWGCGKPLLPLLPDLPAQPDEPSLLVPGPPFPLPHTGLQWPGGCGAQVGLYKCTLYSSQWTVHSVQFSVHSSQCTVLSVQFSVHSSQCISTVYIYFSVYSLPCQLPRRASREPCTFYTSHISFISIYCVVVQCTNLLVHFSGVGRTSFMTPWPSIATALSVASSTSMWEAGEISKVNLILLYWQWQGKEQWQEQWQWQRQEQCSCICRCKSRNVTGEELGLHIQDGCYLVPLEEWQVQGKKLTAPMHPI